MIILNKLESMQKIKMLNLNHFPYIVFTGDNLDEVKKFLKKYPNFKFAIRDNISSLSMKFKNNLSVDEVVSDLDKLSNVTITISGLNYIKNKKITGEIIIYSNMNLILSITTNNKQSTRDASNNPEFYLCSDIYDKRLKLIPYIEEVIDYIFKNNLLDVIVEFSYFNTPVGIKKEKIVIWELRTSY